MKIVGIDVPDNLKERMDNVLFNASKLTDEEYEMLVDDLLTAAENRLKVLMR